MLKHLTCAAVLALMASGCTHLPANVAAEAKVDKGIDGVPCVGTIENVTPGLVEFASAPLLTEVQQPSGKGSLCSVKRFVITQPVRLYRLGDSTRPRSIKGVYWSFDPPTGTRDDYRTKFAICKGWSLLDRLISCEVRPGTLIVVGTTQSANCDEGPNYGKTAANQVFVPNDRDAEIVHTGACSNEVPWPPTGN